jgi:hypothetical protein
MAGRRPLLLASAWAAALLCNYWALEDLLADRVNFDGSWISDLSTRSESSGAIFVALGVASGVAIVVYALLLLGPLGRHGPWVRRGVIALGVSGAFVVVASAAPLSCGEGLEASCHLADDGLDLLHSVATAGEVAATILAFALIAWGLRHRRVGVATAVLGALWLALTIVTGVSYLSHGVDEVKGAFQRVDQVVFGVWLLVLARAATQAAESGGG